MDNWCTYIRGFKKERLNFKTVIVVVKNVTTLVILTERQLMEPVRQFCNSPFLKNTFNFHGFLVIQENFGVISYSKKF